MQNIVICVFIVLCCIGIVVDWRHAKFRYRMITKVKELERRIDYLYKRIIQMDK